MRPYSYGSPPDSWPGVSTGLYGFDRTTRRWNAQPAGSSGSTSSASYFTVITLNLRRCASAIYSLESIRMALGELHQREAPSLPRPQPVSSPKSLKKSVRFAALAEECSPNLQHRTLVPICVDSSELPSPSSSPSRHRSAEPTDQPAMEQPCVILLQGLTGEILASLLNSSWVQEDFLVTPGPQSQRGGGWPDRATRGNITLVSRTLLPYISGNPYVVTFLNSHEGAHAVFLKLGDLVVVNTELETHSPDKLDFEAPQAEQMLCLRAHLRDSEEIPAIVGGLGERVRRSLLHAHNSQGQLYELGDDWYLGASGDKLFCSEAICSRVTQVSPIVYKGKASAGLCVTLHLDPQVHRQPEKHHTSL